VTATQFKERFRAAYTAYNADYLRRENVRVILNVHPAAGQWELIRTGPKKPVLEGAHPTAPTAPPSRAGGRGQRVNQILSDLPHYAGVAGVEDLDVLQVIYYNRVVRGGPDQPNMYMRLQDEPATFHRGELLAGSPPPMRDPAPRPVVGPSPQ